MTRSRNRHQGSKLSNLLWTALVPVAVIILGVAWYWAKQLEAPPFNEETLCSENGSVGNIVMLLDVTDPVAPVQQRKIRSRLLAKETEAHAGTLFTVGLVHPNLDQQGVQFFMCKPRPGDDANELYENPRLIKERYNEKFKMPLEEMLSNMLTSSSSRSSPIMESIQATLADTPNFGANRYPRRLILVTDLLQHSPVFSFYRGETWKSFENSPDFQRLSSKSLGDTHVEILQLPRAEAMVDWEEVEHFWVNYFEIQGAVEVEPILIGDL